MFLAEKISDKKDYYGYCLWIIMFMFKKYHKLVELSYNKR